MVRITIALLLAICSACETNEPVPLVLASAPPDGDVVVPDRYNAYLRAEALSAGYAPDSPEVDRASRTIEMVLPAPFVLSSFSLRDIQVADSTCGETRPLSHYMEPGSLSFARTFTRRETGEGQCDPDGDDRTCDTIRFRMRPGAVRPDTDLEFRIDGNAIRVYRSVGGTRSLGGTATVSVSVRNEDPSDTPVLIGYTLRIAGEGGVLPGLLERGAGGEYFFPPSGVIRGEFDRRPKTFNAILEDDAGTLRFSHEDIPIGGAGGPYRGSPDWRVDRQWDLAEHIARFEIVTDAHFAEFGTPRRFLIGAPAQSQSGVAYVHRVGLTATEPSVTVTSFTIAHVRIEDSSCPVLPTSGDFVIRATRLRDTVAQVEVLAGPADRSELPAPIPFDADLDDEEVTITVDAADLAGGDRVVLVRGLDADGASLGSDRMTVSSSDAARTQTIEAAIRDIKSRGPHYYDLSSADRACFDALVTARQRRRGRSTHHSPTCAQRAPFPSADLYQEPKDCPPTEQQPQPSP